MFLHVFGMFFGHEVPETHGFPRFLYAKGLLAWFWRHVGHVILHVISCVPAGWSPSPPPRPFQNSENSENFWVARGVQTLENTKIP